MTTHGAGSGDWVPFSAVIGHRDPVRLLRRAVASGRPAHAYLFLGPPGVGKGTLARALVSALFCRAPGPEGEPCGRCRECRALQEGRHPDLHLLRPPAGKARLGIEGVREAIAEANRPPFQAPWQAFLFERAEALTPEAANALLKTLEEPPPRTLLLLCAPSPQDLLPTLVSRCAPVPLRPVPFELLRTGLEERGIPAEEAALLAALAGGVPGRALALAGDPGRLEARRAALDELRALLAAGVGGRIEAAGRLEALFRKDPQALFERLRLWRSWWQDLLHLKVGTEGVLGNPDRREELEAVVGDLALTEIREALTALLEGERHLRANVNPRLALEALLLAWPRWGDGGPV